MRAWVQPGILALRGGGAYAWHDQAEAWGVPKPLALLGLEKAPRPAPRGVPPGGQLPVVVAPIRTGTVIERVESVGTVRGREAFNITTWATGIDPAMRSIRLISDFDNLDEALKPCLFLTVELTLENRPNAMLIPEEALDPVGESNFVFAIRAGPSASDQVVVRGLQRLRNDAPHPGRGRQARREIETGPRGVTRGRA